MFVDTIAYQSRFYDSQCERQGITNMGTSYTNEYYAAARTRSEAALKGAETKDRKRLADKIVTVCIDTTITQIIRPGPTPEERECYDVANELRAIKDQLVTLVAEVLRISDAED